MRKTKRAYLTAALATCLQCGPAPQAATSGQHDTSGDRTFEGIVDQAGRTIVLDGLTLDLPPGALAGPARVTIDRVPAPGVPGARGEWYRLGPTGLGLATPATVELEGVAASDDVVKAVEYFDEAGERATALQALPQTELEGGRRRAGLRGFSKIGRTGALAGRGCRKRRAPPILTEARYDACADQLRLAWNAAGPVWVQMGYRAGRRAGDPVDGVTWLRLYEALSPSGRLSVRPGVYPGPDELAHVFVFRAFQVDTCGSVPVLSPPESAAIPAPTLAPPRPPERVRADRDGATIRVRWALPDGFDPADPLDAFDVARRPPWPDGLRRVAAGRLTFEDRDAASTRIAFGYRVRARREVDGCAAPLTSDWVSTDLPPLDGALQQTCGALVLTVRPPQQVIHPQTTACLAAETCPDAVIDATFDRIDGAPVGQVVFQASSSSRAPAEYGLFSIESPDALPTIFPGRVILASDSAPTVSARVIVRAPEAIFEDGEPLPTTWTIFTGNEGCNVGTSVTVEPL